MNSGLVILAVCLAAGAVSSAAQSPSINGRNTTARAQITGSPKLRDGAFTASGVSGVCGVIPKEASLTGEAIFVIEFPNDAPTGTITSVSFGSKELVGGVTKSSPVSPFGRRAHRQRRTAARLRPQYRLGERESIRHCDPL